MPKTIITETCQPVSASVIWLHGLGADGDDFAGIIPQLGLPKELGIRFIFPHAPVRPVTLNNGFEMRAWYDLYSLENVQQEDDIGIQQSEKIISNLIQEQLTSGIKSHQIFLAGFSQGGAMALFTGLRYPLPLGGILGLSTYLPLASSFNPNNHPANRQTPLFLAHGQYDEILPFAFGEKTRDILKTAHYPITWRPYPMSHQVCTTEIADISHWLQMRTR